MHQGKRLEKAVITSAAIALVSAVLAGCGSPVYGWQKPGVTPIAAEAALANCRREARDRFKESSPEFKNEVTDCMKGQEYRYGSY